MHAHPVRSIMLFTQQLLSTVINRNLTINVAQYIWCRTLLNGSNGK